MQCDRCTHINRNDATSTSNTRESGTQTEDKVQFQVKTEAGFKDLDKKLDLTMDGRATVAQLKAFIEVRYEVEKTNAGRVNGFSRGDM